MPLGKGDPYERDGEIEAPLPLKKTLFYQYWLSWRANGCR